MAWDAEESHDVFYQLQVARLDPALGLQHYETCYTGRQTEFLIDQLPQHGWEVPPSVGALLGFESSEAGPSQSIQVTGCLSDYRLRVVAINSAGRSSPSETTDVSPVRFGRHVVLDLPSVDDALCFMLDIDDLLRRKRGAERNAAPPETFWPPVAEALRRHVPEITRCFRLFCVASEYNTKGTRAS